MEKTTLKVLIKPDNRLPPIVIGFPQQGLQEKLAVEHFSDRRQDWSCGGVGFYGKGIYMRYAQYHVASPVTLYSIPMESVVTLHVQIQHEAYFALVDGPAAQKLWPEDQCRVFWQGTQALEQHMLPGQHTQLDLFFRPDAFREKVDPGKWAGLLQEMDTKPFGGLDDHVYMAGKPLEQFFFDLFAELMDEKNKPTVARFQYLMDCLLPMAMGETVEVEPRPPVPAEAEAESEADEHPEESVEKHRKPREKELGILAGIADLDRAGLERKLSASMTELDRLTEASTHEREEANALFSRYEKANQALNHAMAGAFMEIARRFAAHASARTWTESQQKKLKKAILASCGNAFDFRIPSREELDFYAKWGGGARILAGPTSHGLREFSQLLGGLQGVKKVDYTGVDDTPEGRALFEEKMREQFGFVHTSRISGQTEQDKPVEVVRLYHQLMTSLADSMELDEQDGPSRSDAIRLLDHAYEYDDYLALLRLELKYLGSDGAYVARQDDDRLRWYIVAVQCAHDQAVAEKQRFQDTDAHNLFERHRRKGGDEAAFTALVEERRASYTDSIEKMLWVGEILSDQLRTKKQVLQVAATMKRLSAEDDD